MNLKNQRSSQKAPPCDGEANGETPTSQTFEDKYLAQHNISDATVSPAQAALNDMRREEESPQVKLDELISANMELRESIMDGQARLSRAFKQASDGLIDPSMFAHSQPGTQIEQNELALETTDRKGSGQISAQSSDIRPEMESSASVSAKTAIASNTPCPDSRSNRAKSATIPLMTSTLKTTLSKHEELLRCPEQLNPDDGPLSRTAADESSEISQSDPRPVLKICLGLPKSSREIKITKGKNLLPQKKSNPLLLRDGQAFGGHGKPGMSYMKNERKLRGKAYVQQKVSMSGVFALPKHLLTSEGAEGMRGFDQGQRNQEAKRPSSMASCHIFSNYSIIPEVLRNQHTHSLRTPHTQESSKQGKFLTRNYLTSQSFTHLFNIRPASPPPQIQNPSTQTSTSSTNIKSKSNPIALKVDPPTKASQHSPNELKDKDQHQGKTQLTLEKQQSSLQQQTQQLAQRRHLLSKRTRVSAQNSSTNSGIFPNDDSSFYHQSSGKQLRQQQSLATAGSDQRQFQDQIVSSNRLDRDLPLKKFKSTAIATGSSLAQTGAGGNNDLLKYSKQTSIVSMTTQATLTAEHPTSRKQLLSDDNLVHGQLLMPVSTEQVVIENDSKEVLLRMFERLISQEQAQAAMMGSGHCRKRDQKQLSKVTRQLLQIQHQQQQQKLAVKDAGISMDRTLSQAVMGEENPEEAADLRRGRDGVYRIQFQPEAQQRQIQDHRSRSQTQ